MYKRGSGSPIIDIRTSSPKICSECYECNAFTVSNANLPSGQQSINMTGGYTQIGGQSVVGGRVVAEVVLWVKKGSDKSVRRRLEWTPCTGDDMDWVMCAQVRQIPCCPLVLMNWLVGHVIGDVAEQECQANAER